MISLERERSAQAVAAKYRGKGKHARDLELLQIQRDIIRGTLAQHSFRAAFWKGAKTQLRKESADKCAYCEATTAIVAHGDVEHYRPKSVYWWLAYTYDNYLYACQICNQSYKNDAFPTAGPAPLAAPVVDAQATDADLQQLVGQLSPDPLATTAGYKLTHYEQEHQQEQALLLNPYLDDPTQYFAYEADEVTQEVTLVAAHPAASAYVTAAEQYYGLNRVELKTLRYKIYKAFRLLQRALLAVPEADLRVDIAQQLQEMQAADYLFAGMNRYFATQSIPI